VKYAKSVKGIGGYELKNKIKDLTKKSESFTVIANGIKLELKADKDGVLSGAVVDLDNGKYLYKKDVTTSADAISFSNDVFSATNGGAPYQPLSNPVYINGYAFLSGTTGIFDENGAAVRSVVLKVNTVLPIKHLKFNVAFGQATAHLFQISSDNVNWTTLTAGTVDQTTQQRPETELMNGLNNFYIRFNKPSGSAYLVIDTLEIEADLDTSKVPASLFYPINQVNQFTETLLLPSVATRIYYRLNKFTNENRVIMPALEYTDASGNHIGYTSLKLDNSQETNPAIAIVKAETTNGQASGTGSDEGNNYILNDGEYMTLSSAVAEIKIVYLVGKGTTAFTNITKNTYYVSSNGESDDATQDPSHQCNVIIGARQQGLLQTVGDIQDEIQDVKKGVADTQQLVRNNSLIVGFDNGTTDDYAITLPDFKGYTTGMSVLFKANTVNTGACTLNINGMGAKAIVKGITTALSNADILALMWCQCVYDGVAFVLLNPRAL